MVRRLRPIVATTVVAALLGGCGASAGRDAPRPTADRARVAVERGVLSSVRTAPGIGSVASVHCVARGAGGRRFSCHLAGSRPQDVTVTVNDDGWWAANDVRAAAAPQMSADGDQTGDVAAGAALTGCCVPLP